MRRFRRRRAGLSAAVETRARGARITGGSAGLHSRRVRGDAARNAIGGGWVKGLRRRAGGGNN